MLLPERNAKMKILMVTDKMDIGGAETHIFTLITQLVKRGESVTVLSSGGVYAKQLARMGIRVLYSPLDKRDPFSIIRCTRDLGELMRECDLVHTHTRYSSYLASRVRGKSSYPPIVVTAHLNFRLFPFGKLAFWGDRTLAVSEDIKSYLLKNYLLDDLNIHITRNSLDTQKYNLSRIPQKLIIHTSRIDKGRAKTAFLLCDVAEIILPKYRDWRILIVGDGNCFERLKRRASQVNLALGFEGVILCGARYDIPAILRYGAIFVGVSRSALEGMASGLPTIICGDEGYGGLLTEDNYSLLLKTNFCARGLQSATLELLLPDIEFLINNESIARSVAEYGRRIIETGFTAERMASDASECYSLTRCAPSVCLLGYFGYGNLGDEMILKAALSLLEATGISDVCVPVRNSKSNDIKKYSRGRVKLKLYDRMNPHDVIRAIGSSDVLILCGGNLLQNETSFASLLYYSQIAHYARSHGKRIYVLSGGFGDLRGIYAKYLAAKCLSRTDFCGCRTSYDLDFAKKYAKRAYLMPDLCFMLEAKKGVQKKNAFAWVASKNRSITLSDVLNISAQRALTPIALILNPEDETRCEEIKKHGIAVFAPADYEDFAGVTVRCAFTLSERLHGAIFSLTCHIPAYLSANSVKNKALISEIDKIIPGNSVLLAYSKDAALAKKEIGAKDSDFDYLIDFERRNISNALKAIFN